MIKPWVFCWCMRVAGFMHIDTCLSPPRLWAPAKVCERLGAAGDQLDQTSLCPTSIRSCSWHSGSLDPLAYHGWSFRIEVYYTHPLSTSDHPICWPIFPPHVPTIGKHIISVNLSTNSCSLWCQPCHIFLSHIQMSSLFWLITFVPTFISRVYSHWTWMVERRAGDVWDCNGPLNSKCWVENPEWLALCEQFLPNVKSLSCKVLTQCLIPAMLKGFKQAAQEQCQGLEGTLSYDGWTGGNHHHYIMFMVNCRGQVSVHNSH